MSFISRGFRGRRRMDVPPDRLPPGQYVVEDFPVLSAGPTPRIKSDEWQLTVTGAVEAEVRWNWDDFLELPIEEVQVDIHCVTKWSKLDTKWRGVSVDTILAAVRLSPEAAYVTAHSYGGYTTNLPLTDVTQGRAWVAFEFDGRPLEPAHGGPARLLVPHLYFWKSAKWVRELEIMTSDYPGFWERNGYHMYGDPWLEQRYSGD